MAKKGAEAELTDFITPRRHRVVKKWFIGDFDATKIEVDYLNHLKSFYAQATKGIKRGAK